ncbi:MAG: DUF72 domain-containing protein [Rectinemataceae bacterium]|jgi:uncharacterized protein YecE (DUF72 family)
MTDLHIGTCSWKYPSREGLVYSSREPSDALTLTHHHGKKGASLEANNKFLDVSLFLNFLDSVAPIVPPTGLFIFQFEYLNKDKMVSKEKFYHELGGFLSGLPSDLPYAVEIRNPKWLDREQGLYPAPLGGSWRMEERTGEDWSKIIRPKDENLHRISEVVLRMLGRGVEVFVNVNNHYEGSAPLTIAKRNAFLDT